MSDTLSNNHPADPTEGRHRGPASADEAERAERPDRSQPQGRHRRPSEN